jgi:hypothetical protein
MLPGTPIPDEIALKMIRACGEEPVAVVGESTVELITVGTHSCHPIMRPGDKRNENRAFVHFNQSLELRKSGLVGQVVGTSEAPRSRAHPPHQSRLRLAHSLRGDLLTDRIRPENRALPVAGRA